MKADLGNGGFQSEDKRKVLVVSENSRTYRLNNQNGKTLLCYKIDDGLIPTTAIKKCDYGIGLPDEKPKPRFYLIELKGHQLSQAAKQINVTLDELEPKLRPCCFEGRVVLSRVAKPDLRDSSLIGLQKRLAKLGGSLLYKGTLLEETLP